MQTKTRITSVIGKDGFVGNRGKAREQDPSIVELDATYARLLGIIDGQKVLSPMQRFANSRLTASSRSMLVYISTLLRPIL